MGPASNVACPKCGFGYAWDGTQCGHCQYPRQISADEAPNESSEVAAAGGQTLSGARRAIREVGIFVGILGLFLFGSLLALGTFLKFTGWFDIKDYTVAYLACSVAIGLAEVIGAVHMLRSHGRPTKLAMWIMGATYIWIPVSAAIVFNFLPNIVPKWLAISYLVYLFLPLPLVLWSHWGLVKKSALKEVAPEEFPPESSWGLRVYGIFHAAFAVACCALLIGVLSTRERVDAAIDELTTRLDTTDELLTKADGTGPLSSEVVAFLTVEEHHGEVIDRVRELVAEPLTRPQKERLVAIMGRVKDQQEKSRQIIDRVRNARVEQVKKE